MGARQAREELELDEPGARIRNDPAAGLDLNVADRAKAVNAAAARFREPGQDEHDEDPFVLRIREHIRVALRNGFANFEVRLAAHLDAAFPPQQHQPQQMVLAPQAQGPPAAPLPQPRQLAPRPLRGPRLGTPVRADVDRDGQGQVARRPIVLQLPRLLVDGAGNEARNLPAERKDPPRN